MTDFLIGSLFFTNLFVLFYNNLLRYLNTSFPAPIPQEFIRVEAVPEPYEIPLYLSLAFLFAVFIYLAYRYFRPNWFDQIKKNRILFILLKWVLFFFLLLLFIENIGRYPMSHSIYPYTNQELPLTYRVFLFIYLLTASLIALEAIIFQFLAKVHKKFELFLFGFAIILIAIATFEPRLPMLGHDYSFFLGPIWEIANGKTIFNDVPSLYGFGSVLILTILFKVNLLNVWYLPMLIWILYIAQYFLFFYLVFKVSDSFALSFISLISLLTINFFSLYTLPGTLPQIGPMRWLPLIIAPYLLLKFKRIDSKAVIVIVAGLSFWMIDSGIMLVISYFFTLFLLLISKQIKLFKVLKIIILFITSYVFIFLSINLTHLVLKYKPIDIFMIYRKLQEFARSGFGMIPMEPRIYFWFIPLIYFTSLVYLFRKKVFDLKDQILLFSANIVLVSASYFVGRSHPHNHFHISLLFLMNLFLLLGIFLKKISSTKIKLALYAIVFLFLIIYPAYERQEVITKMIKEKIQRYGKGKIFSPESLEFVKEKYRQEIELIDKEFPEEKILILSDDDTYLFYLSQKENLMNYNPQILNITKADIDISLKNVLSLCPKKIVGDCRLFNKCSSNSLFALSYVLIQPLLLEKIQSSCGFKYVPTVCTQHLCIAQSVLNKK